MWFPKSQALYMCFLWVPFRLSRIFIFSYELFLITFFPGWWHTHRVLKRSIFILPFVFPAENLMLPVQTTDYIMDVVSSMERQGIAYSLCFRRVLWLQGLRLDNELLVSIIYHQVQPVIQVSKPLQLLRLLRMFLSRACGKTKRHIFRV